MYQRIVLDFKVVVFNLLSCYPPGFRERRQKQIPLRFDLGTSAVCLPLTTDMFCFVMYIQLPGSIIQSTLSKP